MTPIQPTTRATKRGNKTQEPRAAEHRRSVLSMLLALAALLFLTSMVATAGDGGLYGPAAPPGSAFIRVFNASDTDDLSAKVGNETVPDIRSWNASDFIFLPPGTHPFAAGDSSGSVTLQAGRYYTAVAGSGKVRLIDNDNSGNRLKAMLILYNLTTNSALTLRTQDGKTEVVPGVASDSTGKREVNPAKVQLAVYAGDKKLGDAPPVSLTRGQAFSLFVVGDASAPRMTWAIN